MRVALLTDGLYPYVVGGMQKHSYYLAKYLARNKVHVDLYHTGPDVANTLQLEGFSEDELSFISPCYIPFPSLTKLPGHYVLESYQFSSSVYEQLVSSTAVDFIYAQGFTGWKTIEKKKSGSMLPPIGVNFHGLEMFQPAPDLRVKLQHLLLREPVKYNVRNSDFVFSLGGKLTEILEGLTSKKVVEIPIGIEEKWINEKLPLKKNRPVTLVFVGRYERRKGITELQEALNELIRTHDFKFIFIGPIPTEKQLKQERIKYSGLLNKEDEIQAVLNSADVLVCPSYSEGMPTVILEAMACGLAVVATDVGAVSKLVSSETGWLIKPGDKEALLSALTASVVASDNDIALKKANAANLISSHYTWNKIIKQTIEVISNVTTEKGN
ncbi:glycosyltransferase family 4 protein [Pontibacter silvestris]|uniref:Glycosyltransferase family 4 protein n=1 Tax=Pontibacter silvestris TaxID=2305183 RepID=A0ABW4WWQ0_9BACT|nr:glycosyltransferase family 4 protein [Pontibacter silvestris]MCC9137335.1 glycosyltransferase family 4 protein [Pontibacter silvestris]